MWGFARARLRAVDARSRCSPAALLYVSLRWLLVTPLRRLIASMMAFRDDPEDAARVIVPEPRGDELGLAQRELAAMQETVRQALRQKERLAALGTAVAKINHDLRNILSTARLVSDGLAGSAAPEVRRVTPRLLAAIDRAVALCARTLTYHRRGRAAAACAARFALAALVDELAGLVERRGRRRLRARQRQCRRRSRSTADREQLFRVLQNLALNAVEAGAHHVTVRRRAMTGLDARSRSRTTGRAWRPRRARICSAPFAGSARPGGTGLGLAIAREVMRAHGGDIALAESTGSGHRVRAAAAGAERRRRLARKR